MVSGDTLKHWHHVMRHVQAVRLALERNDLVAALAHCKDVAADARWAAKDFAAALDTELSK